MGCNVTYGSIAVGAYYAHLRGTAQPAFMDQYTPRWDRGGARGPRTRRAAYTFDCLWPRGTFGGCGADASTPYAPIGSDYSGRQGFEPFSCDGDGTQTVRFIRGYSRDSGGAVLANAIVQAFVTSSDAAQVAVTSAADGFFAAPTETIPGVQHYLVAYKTGSPDVAGSTVNTLTSTTVDGG